MQFGPKNGSFTMHDAHGTGHTGLCRVYWNGERGGVTAFAVEFGKGQFARLKPMTARAEQDLIAE